MRWRIVNHDTLSETDLLRVAKIKDQHWSYGIDSQIEWMRKNVMDEDIHLIAESDERKSSEIRAYATLSKINIGIDGKEYVVIGIGSVCVGKEFLNCGLGKALILEANKFIKDNKSLGILLCKDKLVSFYEKCNWQILNYKVAEVAGAPFENKIMLLGGMDSCAKIVIDRNF